MIITLAYDDLASVINHGSVATLTGTGADGLRVTFGADNHMIAPALRALLLEEEDEVHVEIEDWMVLGTRAVEAP